LFVIARLGDDVVGCGGVQWIDQETAEIRRMWVDSGRRGIGLGKRLLGYLEAEARASGRTRVVLDTNGSLTEAISMYRALGYSAIERYNDNPYAHHWFEKSLGRRERMAEPSDLDAALARVKFLTGNLTAGNNLTTTRLAGLTNVNHLVTVSQDRQDRYVLRIPGEGTSEYINRVDEEVAARSAAVAGVNAEVVFFDAADGLMVTRFIDGAATMSAERFRDLDAVARAGQAFRRLHTSAAAFATDFRLFPMIDEYKALLASKGATLPDGYDDVQRQAERVRAALEAAPAVLRPCHCDPLCENFLDTGKQMFIIDYEYAGNNDPMWDLGDLSVEGDFDAEQDHALLQAYFDGDPPPDQHGRMIAYKALCDLLWTLWGVIQHVNGNSADDFWAYAVGRFERCKALMSTAGFDAEVAAITR
jgi:thiamine kinase-like enzyme